MSNKNKLLILTVFVMLFGQASFLNCAYAKKAKVLTPAEQYKYQQKILKRQEIENYKRSLLPESGFMTIEEYEKASEDILNSKRVIPEYKPAKDIKNKYVPVPTYELVRYNDPPGSPELHLDRKYRFDRQINGGAITSPNRDILVYPVVYYYVNNQCTAGDLFVIPLDKTLTGVDRVLRANVIKRNPEPILSTQKSIDEKFTFRTMTPIDFSPDGSKLVAKEKIGNNNDGIWKTNLWVYDFKTGQSREIPEVRDAIRFYWANTKSLVLDEKRWDIVPLGFDSQDPDRVIVSAYGYTGKTPIFLGNWSIDCQGERTQLVSLFEPDVRVSINGLKALKVGVVDPSTVLANEKKQNKAIKKERKKSKQQLKKEKRAKKRALKSKLRTLNQEQSAVMGAYKKQQRKSSPTGID